MSKERMFHIRVALCPTDAIEMSKVFEFETSNCESGCCPSSIKLYQCPKCKDVVESPKEVNKEVTYAELLKIKGIKPNE